MRHITFFLGAQNEVFWVGDKKFMLKKFVLFLSLPKRVRVKNSCSHGGRVYP